MMTWNTETRALQTHYKAPKYAHFFPYSPGEKERPGTLLANSFTTQHGSTMQSLPESTLIQRAREGHPEAINELVRRYQDAIYNLCFRMLGDPHEAEDATQEVFIKMYRRLNKYNDAYRFSTWLLSVASHHCIDRLRKRRISWVSLDAPGVPNKQLAQAYPEDIVIHNEERDHIQGLLDTLKPDQRLILLLHYWYDLSYQQIAQIIGSTEGAVKTRAHRARRQLGKILQQEGWTV